ncbi:MAG: hypothetical protein EZS28_013309 [Streblomastix strix]|uniref:Uncharacterized protein n=1 Tax=Streblomastix strix TaxID=222440 RepID=A0A5J4W8F1_9EUKA|nr:MAG: hypothetical protein EZS28_013309 [Streblomastix strix]
MIGCGVTVGDIIYDEIIIFYFFYGYDEYEIDYDYTDYGLYYCNDLPEYYYFALYAEIGLYLDAEDGHSTANALAAAARDAQEVSH